MNIVLIALGLFFTLSMLASVVVFSALALSGRASRVLHEPDQSPYDESTRKDGQDRDLLKDTALA